MQAINLTHLNPEYRAIFQEINQVLRLDCAEDGTPLFFTLETGAKGISIVREQDNGIYVKAPKKVLFARAVGLIKEKLQAGDFSYEEVMHYGELETMIDCARNAVPTVDTLKSLARHMALMGYTGMQLYVEDVFEIPGYPYFGYLRGAYSQQELRELDDYCDSLGLALIPSIQTLAHLGKAMRWECFRGITDFDDILLADNKDTYDLIEAMIRTMSECMRSRRINIGMDEAHMLGLGNYLNQHGYQNRVDIMLTHFEKVKEILVKYGYSYMMWSDMFFRLLNNGEYGNTKVAADSVLKNMIPQDVELIYWDYYSTTKGAYDQMLDSHLGMSSNIGFAAGAWKWSGFSPYNTYSLNAGQLAHQSCLERGISHMIVTAWGDDGGEASLFSVLPTFQMWAEACYLPAYSDDLLSTRFATCTNGNFDHFLLMDELIETPEKPKLEHSAVNPSRYLFYQDVLYGMFDKHVSAKDTPHFAALAEKLQAAGSQNKEWQYLFETLAAFAHVLSLKTDIGNLLRQAYRSQDHNALQRYVAQDLPELIKAIQTFSEIYIKQWNRENKIFGLDVFDIRIGGLLQRTGRAITRIQSYLNREISAIEELDQEILFYDCRQPDAQMPLVTCAYGWINIATPSVSCNTKSY